MKQRAAGHYAQAGMLVLAPSVWGLLKDVVETMPLADQYVQFVTTSAPLPDPMPLPPATLPSDAATFVPHSIMEWQSRGEFRQVVTVFINLQNPSSHQELHDFMQLLFTLQNSYGGYFNKVDFGDKGCTLLLFWGTPVSFENDLQRALSFILALSRRSPLTIKAGITFKRIFSGFGGSVRRGEFTCYGDGVNLAARLMVAAPWNTIWLDYQVANRVNQQFVLKRRKAQRFKGVCQTADRL